MTRKRLSGRHVQTVARQFFRRLTKRRHKAQSVQAAGFSEWRRTVVSSHASYTSFSTQHSHLVRGFASFHVRIHTTTGSQGRHIALLVTLLHTQHEAISQTVCS